MSDARQPLYATNAQTSPPPGYVYQPQPVPQPQYQTVPQPQYSPQPGAGGYASPPPQTPGAYDTKTPGAGDAMATQTPGPPPSFEAAVAQGAISTAYDPPPDYFDFSIVPQMSILTPQTAPPIDGPTSVVAKKDSDGSIRSCDARLDTDANELWRYFASNMHRPGLIVRIHGTHQETRHRTVTEHRDGRTHHRTETYHETVTDFDVHLDASHYVLNQWTRIVESSGMNIRQTLEEYTTSGNIFKEISLTKQLLWDFNALTRAIEYTVRSTGFRHDLSISYEVTGRVVKAYSSNLASQAAHNTCVKVLCVLTCLCIIFAPIYYLSRHKINRIVVEYPMATSENDFFQSNYATIFTNVIMRNCHGVVVAL